MNEKQQRIEEWLFLNKQITLNLEERDRIFSELRRSQEALAAARMLKKDSPELIAEKQDWTNRANENQAERDRLTETFAILDAAINVRALSSAEERRLGELNG